jgi:hypothetical protein
VKGRKPSPAIAARNKAIAEAYAAGELARVLGEQYGLSPDTIRTIAQRMGVPGDPLRGYRQQLRTYERNPELAERHRRNAQEALVHFRPQPRVWPTCPPEKRQDYETLKAYYGAREARRMLEGAA